MKIVAIDFESTGLDVTKDRIIEVGAVSCIFDTELRIEAAYSTFVYEPDYPELPPEVVEVTGITPEKLKSEGGPFLGMWEFLEKFSHGADYFLAHNKNFDQGLLFAELNRRSLALPKVPWLCTIEDVEHPEKFRCRKLSHLALDYGAAVNPRLLHRALDDVKLMIEMCQVAQFDFNKIGERAKIPWVIVRAKVPSPFGAKNDGGVGKDKAKACGYSWEKVYGMTQVFDKSWVKRIKEADIAKEQERLGYAIAVVG